MHSSPNFHSAVPPMKRVPRCARPNTASGLFGLFPGDFTTTSNAAVLMIDRALDAKRRIAGESRRVGRLGFAAEQRHWLQWQTCTQRTIGGTAFLASRDRAGLRVMSGQAAVVHAASATTRAGCDVLRRSPARGRSAVRPHRAVTRSWAKRLTSASSRLRTLRQRRHRRARFAALALPRTACGHGIPAARQRPRSVRIVEQVAADDAHQPCLRHGRCQRRGTHGISGRPRTSGWPGVHRGCGSCGCNWRKCAS